MSNFLTILKNFNPFIKRDLIKNSECPFFEVDNTELSKFIVKKILPISGYSPFPLNELLLLVGSVIRFKPDVIFDWGTHIGKSARIFYESKEFFKINCTIHSIDLPDEIFHIEHPRKLRGSLVKNTNVFLHLGDGIETSLKLLEQYNYQKPLFYIDGDHSFESVKRELSIIMNRVPNAIILLHDTFFQTEESGYNIGPYQAIKECLSTNDSYKIITLDMGLPGMTLLYK
jgi:hypothetical protein